jgi:prepilin-type processing-associated H-X9-DG protein
MFAAKQTYLGGGIIGSQWDQDPRAVTGIAFTTLPANGVTDSIGGGTSNIVEGIYTSQAAGHILNAKLRFCPAAGSQYMGANGVFYYGNRPLPSYKFAYYANATGAANANQPPPYWNVNKFKEHSNKLLMCDSNAKDNYGDCVTWVDDSNATGVIRNLNGASAVAPRVTSSPYSSKDEIKERHGGKGNVLFLDGHVDCVPWSEYVKNICASPTDTDAAKRWTRLSQ